MSFLKKLANLFSSPSGGSDTSAYWVTVKCKRCGEVIRTRINLNNDLSAEYGEGGGDSLYCRKMLMGENRCFQRIEIELTFDANRRLLSKEISGGQFVEETS